MFWRWLKAILLLPGVVLGLVPVLLVLASKGTRLGPHPAAPTSLVFSIGVFLACSGVALSIWTVGLFARHGEGTAAPWDPPRRFVVRGPYRYVRNPMMISVFMNLLAEVLLVGSWVLAGWLAMAIVINLIYIPRVEEPHLVERFGVPYEEYRRHVPRWIPRPPH